MKLEKIALALTVLNLALLLVALPQGISTAAAPLVLRGQTLELTDDSGKVRARLNVEPDGEVVFRLFDQGGTIRVKLGASESGSGMVLLDERTEPAVQMIARQVGGPSAPGTTGIALRGKDGRIRAIEP